MQQLTIECPRDPRLYATLDASADGIEVRVWRRGVGLARDHARQLAEMTVDAPLHLVRDRVHAMLLDLHKGEYRD